MTSHFIITILILNVNVIPPERSFSPLLSISLFFSPFSYFFLQPPFLPFRLLFLLHFPRFFTKEKWPKGLCCIIRCQQAKIFTVPFPWISLSEIMTDLTQRRTSCQQMRYIWGRWLSHTQKRQTNLNIKHQAQYQAQLVQRYSHFHINISFDPHSSLPCEMGRK